MFSRGNWFGRLCWPTWSGASSFSFWDCFCREQYKEQRLATMFNSHQLLSNTFIDFCLLGLQLIQISCLENIVQLYLHNYYLQNGRIYLHNMMKYPTNVVGWNTDHWCKPIEIILWSFVRSLTYFIGIVSFPNNWVWCLIWLILNTIQKEHRSQWKEWLNNGKTTIQYKYFALWEKSQ